MQPQPYGNPYPYPHMPYGVPSDFEPPQQRRPRAAGIAVAAFVAAAVAVGGSVYAVQHSTIAGSGSTAASGTLPGNSPQYHYGTGNPNGSTGTTGLTTASAAQSVGVVDINTVLGYEQARAAGTGMIVSSSGEVLTNNHVIEGATSIRVTVVSTGRSYSAKVVGTDPTDDVAVIQMSGASGLQTVSLGSSSGLHTGTAVTGVGNAGGSGGRPSAATGQITALDQSLTASDDNGQNPERLTGMIQINAPIEPGDSGGPLYNGSDRVIGMDTAAATNAGRTVAGYAIPIDKALSIATQIESGKQTATIHIGYPGFLGVSVADAANGALIENVVSGGPAEGAGMTAGDVITSVNGQAVVSSSALKAALTGHKPGQQVTIGWVDQTGGQHSKTVTLMTGPAD
jgi:S1-C subfamily serine protease